MSINVGWVPEPQRIVHETKADFSGKQVSYKQIHVVQYDRSLPIIAVELYKNGLLYTIPTNATIKIRWGKKDRTFVYKDVLGCDVERHVVYFDIDEQMSIYDGLHKPILEVTVGGQSAGSTEIPIMVDRNPVQMDDVMSESPYPFAQVAVTGSYYDLLDIPETLENIKLVDALPSNLREVDLKLLYRINGTNVNTLYVIDKVTESGQTSYVAKLLATQEYVSNALLDYVDLASNQTITGEKTFNNNVNIKNTILFQGEDGSFVITLSADNKALRPSWGDHYSLGTSGYKWKDLHLNENIYLGNSTTAGKGMITFQNPVLNNQGDWYIDSPTQNGIRFMQKTQNTGVQISRGIMYPLTTAYFTLGNNNYRWKTLFLSHYVDWGNNVMIGKDSSNRFYVTDSAGNTKIKVGQNETYFVNHVEPDANKTYDLGRTGVGWKDLYLNNAIYMNNAASGETTWSIQKDGINQIGIYAGSDLKYTIQGGVFKSMTNGGADLGSNNARWKDLYLSGNLSDGTNAMTIAQIATKDWVNENAVVNVTDLRSI